MSGHVFISYAREDREYVDKLANHLEQHGIRVWYDRHLGAGTVWTADVEREIDTCAALIVVMTDAARASRWVSRELAFAERKEKNILPILLEGDPLLPVSELGYEALPTRTMPSSSYIERIHEVVNHPGRLLFEMKVHDGHVLSVAYPGGNSSLVASAGPEMCVRVWNPATGELRLELRNATWPASFMWDGSIIATGGPDYTVHLWDTTTGRLLRRVAQHTGRLVSIAISPDGLTLVTGAAGHDRSERVWDLETGALRHTLSSGLADPASPLVFFPDGERVIAPTSGGARCASLWNVKTGRLIKNLNGHNGLVHDVTVSRDGRFVATGGADHTARIWDARSGPTLGTELRTLGAHTQPVRAVAFSPNGQRLATGSTDTSIRLWDAANGAHVKKITRSAGGIYDLAYSPDGRTLASGHGDGAVRIWTA